MGIRQIFETSVKIESFAPGPFSTQMVLSTRKTLGKAGVILRSAARARVMPGVGPGPHPHRTKHEDTGNLARNIVYRVTGTMAGGNLEVGPKPGAYYGTYLELGWHAANGMFYKYPWLRPALKSQWPAMSHLLLAEGKLAFNTYFRNPSNRAASVKLIKGR